MLALPSPHAANAACLALLITGNVIVTLEGGGLGESLIGATHKVFSCKTSVISFL